MTWLRRLPASVCARIEETVCVALQVAPPSVETNAMIEVKFPLSMATTTVPFGWMTGSAASPVASLAGCFAALHVSPPSGRGAHLDDVAVAVVVPFGVAATVERAGGRVVTGHPILVQV